MAGACPNQSIEMKAGDHHIPWFAVQVKARQEKMVSSLLHHKDFECFLPLYRCRRRWSDRVKELALPLFSGYLFCRLEPRDRLQALKTPGVMQIVGAGKIPISVDDAEIAAIRSIVDSGLSSHPCPFVEVGQMARIEEGPLRGVTGIVVQVKSQQKLIVSVPLLKRSVAVEINRAWLGYTAEAYRAAVAKRLDEIPENTVLRTDKAMLVG
jgi:transcription antitermination factor NusG